MMREMLKSRKRDIPLCLHDCLSLGEVELGFCHADDDEGLDQSPLGADFCQPKDDEIDRLPILLRILQSARPLSNISIINEPKPITEESASCDDHDELTDCTILEVVNRLEDRAAFYSAAEGVQVVACHLAPAVTRPFWRIPPLTRLNDVNANCASNAGGSLDRSCKTLPLEQALELIGSARGSAPSSNLAVSATGRKRKRTNPVLVEGDEEETPDAVAVNEIETTRRSKGRTGSLLQGEATHVVSEDTQEFVVTKTLHDLICLTVKSLKQAPINSSGLPNVADEDGDGGGRMLTENFSLSINHHDSILSEVAKSIHHEKQVGSCDLASTVASLMHYVTCLRHRHVASALCRGAFSQAPELIYRMGANCPCSVQLLVSGCLDVYRYAASNKLVREQEKHSYSAISNVCRKSLQKLSRLSNRDLSRVQFKVSQEQFLMADLQLELAIESGPMSTACFLIEHLSPELYSDNNAAHPTSDGTEWVFGRDFGSSSSGNDCTRSLQELYTDSSKLLFRTIELLNQGIHQHSGDRNTKSAPVGQVSPILRALSLMMCRLDLSQFLTDINEQLSQLLSTTISNILFLVKSDKQKRNSVSGASTLPHDHVFNSALAALLLTMLALFPTSDNDNKEIFGVINLNALKMHALSSIRDCIGCCPQSPGCRAMATLSELVLDESDLESLKLVLSQTLILGSLDSRADSALLFDGVDINCRLQHFWEWIGATTTLGDHVEEESALLLDPYVISCRLLSRNISNIEKCSYCTAVIQAIFDLETKNEFLLAISDARMINLFAMASSHINTDPSLGYLPLVLPVQMERLAVTISSEDMEGVNHPTLVFLAKLMYCFFFLQRFPNSPFTIDPRMIPLKEVYVICEQVQIIEHSLIMFCNTLKGLIDRQCPEIRMRARTSNIRNTYYRQFKRHHRRSKSDLTRTLRRSIESLSSDPTGMIAAKMLLASGGHLAESDLTTITATALLSKPFSPALFYTYPMLYRDPLCILKCSLALWKRPGIRRLALTVLTLLLETNEHVVGSEAYPENHDEFLQSRNIIVVRGLIRSFADHSIAVPCLMVTGVIRKILASNRGAASTLLKQVLTNEEVDCLVEIAPEMINDTSSFMTLFSDADRALTGPGEKLLISDGILRVLSIRGYQNELEALIQAIMAHLINSFFFVVGMAGMHPNTLSGDGRELVEAIPKAAFRIFKTLHKIRHPRTRLRNESVMFLQKFVGLCKGEIIVGNLPAAVTNRQKGLIKELLDASLKAADSMGLVL